MLAELPYFEALKFGKVSAPTVVTVTGTQGFKSGQEELRHQYLRVVSFEIFTLLQ